ncbi:MAG: ATP-dependent DNA helicase [Clostridia bacterium]|nr:ATP-dependent DNA helicase [Clostridia bacterium]
MTVFLELDEALDMIAPWTDGEKSPPKRPDAAARTLFFGEEAGRFRDTRLTLILRSGEEEVHISGNAHGVHPGSDLCPYTVEEELLVDRMCDFPRYRERCLLRAQFLTLALINTKGLERAKIRLCVFGEGRMEMEEQLWEKEALSHSLSPHIRALLPITCLWEKPEIKITFPYRSLREGQKELIHAAWDAITSSTRLYACAPTGIGKTLAVLYPALRALSQGKCRRVFYASPKNTLKMQAAAAVESLQEVRGLRTLVMGARGSLCPEKEEECRREECPYFQNFSAKLPEALRYLTGFSCITPKELEAAARSFHLCPFRLAKQIGKFCQVIIGDYNHVFDPARSVFPPEKDAVLLIDEAHNLPARIRENFTETLSPRDLDPFFRDPTPPSQMLREHFANLAAHFARIDQRRSETKEYFSFEMPRQVIEAAGELLPKVTFALHGGFGVPSEETEKNLWALYRKLKKFIGLSVAKKGSFATVYPLDGGCRIYLVDPKEIIEDGVAHWRSALFFSATLLPKEYYFELLAGRDEDAFLELTSPFPQDNLFVGICHVDVSHSQRFATAPKICSIIHSAVSARPGNYMVFLPSFEYLNLVSQEYKHRHFQHRVLVQERVMTAKKRRDFLKCFEENRKGTLIGFCVMGGIFSEGVDLKGDSLCGEIIVGTGFPPPSPESQAESAFYYEKEMDGKSFAYTLPGWSRVLQAAGRVIRDEEDRGFLILCDARYQGEDMRQLFPENWDHAVVLEREAVLRERLQEFWK